MEPPIRKALGRIFPFILRSQDFVLHYTCNSPSAEILRKYGIKTVGEDYGCDNAREVLQIPISFLEKKRLILSNDKPLMILNLERLMRELR